MNVTGRFSGMLSFPIFSLRWSIAMNIWWRVFATAMIGWFIFYENLSLGFQNIVALADKRLAILSFSPAFGRVVLIQSPIHIHTNPWGRLKWPYAKSPGWQPTLYVAWCLSWWFANLEKYGHTWHRISLLRPGVIKQHKPSNTKWACSTPFGMCNCHHIDLHSL